MLSLLLITAALTAQYPSASKPAQDTSATKRTTATTRTQQATSKDAVSRAAFHDRMRELWTDHIVYTRNFIVAAAANQADTAEVAQRLLRNQDEIGDAIKPYYGDAAGSQLASLLRNHIQLAAKTVAAAKGNNVAMQSTTSMNMNMPMDSTTVRRDTTGIKANSQYPTESGRMADTTRGRAGNDTSRVRAPTTARVTGDTTKAKNNPTPAYPNTPSTAVTTQNQTTVTAQATPTGQVDSTSLNQAIAALRANGDSIAALLNSANPKGFALGTMKGAISMHLDLLLQEATAHLKKDWTGSITAFDKSLDQVLQMADMLSEGVMKQFPSRFTNKATTVSSLQ